MGPSTRTRVSSKAARKAAGATSTAHRLRRTSPAPPPTARLITIDQIASLEVSGPRGVHHPAASPHTTRARRPPRRRRDDRCARAPARGAPCRRFRVPAQPCGSRPCHLGCGRSWWCSLTGRRGVLPRSLTAAPTSSPWPLDLEASCGVRGRPPAGGPAVRDVAVRSEREWLDPSRPQAPTGDVVAPHRRRRRGPVHLDHRGVAAQRRLRRPVRRHRGGGVAARAEPQCAAARAPPRTR